VDLCRFGNHAFDDFAGGFYRINQAGVLTEFPFHLTQPWLHSLGHNEQFETLLAGPPPGEETGA